MAKKLSGWKTKGMNRDLSVSAFNPEFAFENMNLRLATNENNTLLSWVNERGTAPITLVDENWVTDNHDTPRCKTSIEGTPIGTAVLNHQLVLFTHAEDKDRIYVIKYKDSSVPNMKALLLYEGSLSFDVNHPLEILVSYESEIVQKVYWVDGINQPRVANIKGDYTVNGNYKPSLVFDFVCELQLNETVKVKKIFGGNGMFAPGVIQYAFTYYNKYGQESNIFYTTPLYYISHRDRGASPEDKVDNAFQISISGIDTNFEYIRIYSIQRTSIDGTPICKRVQDIAIEGLSNNSASYTDTGMSGDSVDPTELLYKGGSAIKASTLEQKDMTLFLGDITLQRSTALDSSTVFRNTPITNSGLTRAIFPMRVFSKDYIYYSQLSSYDEDGNSTPCAGFKYGDVYRLGMQFQDKWGAWCEPVYIGNKQVLKEPTSVLGESQIQVPIMKGTLTPELLSLIPSEYKKVRAVVVFPNIQDRLTICQGVINPTLYTEHHRTTDKDIYAQSSWFFRPYTRGIRRVDANGAVAPRSYEISIDGSTITQDSLEYTQRNTTPGSPDAGKPAYNPSGDLVIPATANIREVEIQGDYDDENKFHIDLKTVTFHSPDLEFDDQMYSVDFSGLMYRKAGDVQFSKTFSDISIQTETPTASNDGGGFQHKSFTRDGVNGIVSGLFYDDYIINDTEGRGDVYIGPYSEMYNSAKWMVYLWNKTGSLNNDINRPVNEGTPTAVLKKKVISNLRYSSTKSYNSIVGSTLLSFMAKPALFASDQTEIIKLSSENSNFIYMGNIDTVLNPDNSDGMYFVFNSKDLKTEYDVKNDFIKEEEQWWKTFYDQVTESGVTSKQGAPWYFDSGRWVKFATDFFSKYLDCAIKKDLVRIKYKTTPHLVFSLKEEDCLSKIWNYRITDISMMPSLPVLELKRNIPESDFSSLYGGESKDALRENIWVPCGEPVRLDDIDSNGNVNFYYEYGDTYYQRYDCLKTYAFTPEDENQVVEIGSFMLETRVNIDGRYDRNRGQLSNINMSPKNFNLLNPVYSQINNMFTYRIVDTEENSKNKSYPNQITWSKTKESGADIDQWTNITLASVLELDGDKGKLNKLTRLNDQILAFQDTGISQILYNENVQISSTDGVPIEIANSGKVQGKRYLSNTIGCSNKWSMTTTPAGIYFTDSHDKSIYLFNGQLQNLSNLGGFASWAKNKIFLTGKQWNPNFDTSDFVTYYDKLNQDVLFINSETALAWSERLQAFTSFYSYESVPYFCNLDDTGIWVKKDADTLLLWKHQAGNYCSFFDLDGVANKPYWMTLVGNPEPQMDKIFTNLEFRACVDGEGRGSGSGVSGDSSTFDETFDYTFHNGGGGGTGKYVPYIPFDYLETWDEYQHGIAQINIRNGHDLSKHHANNFDGAGASLIRKFRIWRCDIPRSNAPLSMDAGMNVFRKDIRPMDRMRNPWLYIKLMKNAYSNQRTEIHDIVMTYFD